MEPRTLADVFSTAAERFPRPDRFLQKTGGAWRAVSTEEFAGKVRACAGALASIGVSRGDRVAILSYNRVEWAIADYACQLLGAPDVPIYSTLPPDQVAYILGDSGSKAIFLENAAQAEKLRGVSIPAVSFENAAGAEPFEDFLRRGKGAEPARIGPDDLATLIYTSGTTGTPKGVMLTHGNLVSNILASCAVLPIARDDLALSFLPLSHSFERLFDYAAFWQGASIAYAEHVDKVRDNMGEVRPTIMAAVPRFYEKVYAGIRKKAQEMKPWKRGLFEWARAVGSLEAEFRRGGRKGPLGLRLRHALAGLLVYRKMAAVCGGRMRHFISGGGALSRDVAEFLFSLGFTVLEGYGLTETSPVLTVNTPGAVRLGTVGRAIPGVELRIAPDGEILARGPNIMKGYYGKPEETAQVLRDGWLATGDIGEIDADGFLRITDRKKDLFKTSGGKYVAPQPIENRLKLHASVANAVVIGDARKFASALIVPAPGATREQVQAAVDEVNQGLAHHEQLKKFLLLERDFSIEGGEITPTLKVKRRFVEKKYQPQIDALYQE
jgi:long-chain acyl-CoA synthetase